MFNQERWRQQIGELLVPFARNPRQEVQIAGSHNLLIFLAVQTIHPFLDAFAAHPVDAVVTLSEIYRGPGADYLVRRAMRAGFLTPSQLEADTHANPDLRIAIDSMLVALNTLQSARQRLNGSREEWLRITLDRDIEALGWPLTQLRQVLCDPHVQARTDALKRLRSRGGRFSPADLVLIHDALNDSTANARSQAARLLGSIASAAHVPESLTRTLVQVALHDCDAETRFAAARAMGTLRHSIVSPDVLAELARQTHSADRFVRSAMAVVAGQLGDLAGTPQLVAVLVEMLQDADMYTREAAARALGQIGEPAATDAVIAALTVASKDGEMQVYEAATDALIVLRGHKLFTKEVALAA